MRGRCVKPSAEATGEYGSTKSRHATVETRKEARALPYRPPGALGTLLNYLLEERLDGYSMSKA
jgi:hypothetical protein